MISSLRTLAFLLITGLCSPVLRGWALSPPPAGPVAANANANLRAKPSVDSEILLTATKGDTFRRIGATSLPKATEDEPREWVTVVAPAGTRVWIFAELIDPATRTVRVPKANLRAGPGRNYSDVGQLSRGAVIQELRSADGWIQIAAPEGSVMAHIAANLVQPAPAPSTPPPAYTAASTPPRQTTPLPPNPTRLPTTTGRSIPADPVVRPQPIDPTPRAASIPSQPVVTATEFPVELEFIPTPAPVQPTAQPTPPSPRPSLPESQLTTPVQPDLQYTTLPRQVLRQGVVKLSLDPHSPGAYQLDSFRKGEGMLAFLYAESPDINLADWHRKHVLVTGEEYINPRWPKYPVIKVTAIDLSY
jgi:hypothetical protein